LLGENRSKEDSMSHLTRRGFVTRSAGAAAGMTALGAMVTQHADAEAVAGSEPVVAYVRDPGRGEISLMSGDREVTVRDRKLAARIVRAAD
jgi:nitrous oxide reductase